MFNNDISIKQVMSGDELQFGLFDQLLFFVLCCSRLVEFNLLCKSLYLELEFDSRCCWWNSHKQRQINRIDIDGWLSTIDIPFLYQSLVRHKSAIHSIIHTRRAPSPTHIGKLIIHISWQSSFEWRTRRWDDEAHVGFIDDDGRRKLIRYWLARVMEGTETKINN